MCGIDQNISRVRTLPAPIQGAWVPYVRSSRVGGADGRASWFAVPPDGRKGSAVNGVPGLTRALSGCASSLRTGDPGRRSRRELALGLYTAARWAASRRGWTSEVGAKGRSAPGRPSLKDWRESAQRKRRAAPGIVPTRNEPRPEWTRVAGATARQMRGGARGR
jgi:hypothetical protein